MKALRVVGAAGKKAASVLAVGIFVAPCITFLGAAMVSAPIYSLTRFFVAGEPLTWWNCVGLIFPLMLLYFGVKDIRKGKVVAGDIVAIGIFCAFLGGGLGSAYFETLVERQDEQLREEVAHLQDRRWMRTVLEGTARTSNAFLAQRKAIAWLDNEVGALPKSLGKVALHLLTSRKALTSELTELLSRVEISLLLLEFTIQADSSSAVPDHLDPDERSQDMRPVSLSGWGNAEAPLWLLALRAQYQSAAGPCLERTARLARLLQDRIPFNNASWLKEMLEPAVAISPLIQRCLEMPATAPELEKARAAFAVLAREPPPVETTFEFTLLSAWTGWFRYRSHSTNEILDWRNKVSRFLMASRLATLKQALSGGLPLQHPARLERLRREFQDSALEGYRQGELQREFAEASLAAASLQAQVEVALAAIHMRLSIAAVNPDPLGATPIRTTSGKDGWMVCSVGEDGAADSSDDICVRGKLSQTQASAQEP